MPLSPFPDCEMARVLVMQGKREEAIALVREILGRWPESVDARNLLRSLETSQAGAKRTSP